MKLNTLPKIKERSKKKDWVAGLDLVKVKLVEEAKKAKKREEKCQLQTLEQVLSSIKSFLSSAVGEIEKLEKNQ